MGVGGIGSPGAPSGGTPGGGAKDEEGLLSALEGAIVGDFSDNSTWSRVGGQTVVGFIPIVGQIADARDTLAAIKGIWDGKEGAWGDLGLAAIAWVPGVGDLAKGALRVGKKAANVAEAGADVLKAGTKGAGGAVPLVKGADELGAGAKSADDIPRGDRLPRTKGTWQGTPGDSAWKSDIAEVNAITGNQPIQFRNGYPDFAPWSQGDVKLPNMKGTDSDFGAADKLFASQNPDKFKSAADVERYRQANELTWHHHQDRTSMQLIPTDLHGNIPHAGGASLAREAAPAVKP